MLVVSSNMFSWDRPSRTFVGGMAELEFAAKGQGYNRLQSKDGEAGFFMRSKRTEQELWFALQERVYLEGSKELQYTTFLSDPVETADGSVRFTANIYND